MTSSLYCNLQQLKTTQNIKKKQKKTGYWFRLSPRFLSPWDFMATLRKRPATVINESSATKHRLIRLLASKHGAVFSNLLSHQLF